MSEELIIEQVTDGSDVTRKWFGFTDKEIILPLLGAVGSAMLLMLNNIGISNPCSAYSDAAGFVLDYFVCFGL